MRGDSPFLSIPAQQFHPSAQSRWNANASQTRSRLTLGVAPTGYRVVYAIEQERVRAAQDETVLVAAAGGIEVLLRALGLLRSAEPCLYPDGALFVSALAEGPLRNGSACLLIGGDGGWNG